MDGNEDSFQKYISGCRDNYAIACYLGYVLSSRRICKLGAHALQLTVYGDVEYSFKNYVDYYPFENYEDEQIYDNDGYPFCPAGKAIVCGVVVEDFGFKVFF